MYNVKNLYLNKINILNHMSTHKNPETKMEKKMKLQEKAKYENKECCLFNTYMVQSKKIFTGKIRLFFDISND